MVDKVRFYLCSSDLEYRRNNYTEAEEFARLAKNKAVDTGFFLQPREAKERLDFMRVITRGHTMVNSKVKVKERMPTLARQKRSLIGWLQY